MKAWKVVREIEGKLLSAYSSLDIDGPTYDQLEYGIGIVTKPKIEGTGIAVFTSFEDAKSSIWGSDIGMFNRPIFECDVELLDGLVLGTILHKSQLIDSDEYEYNDIVKALNVIEYRIVKELPNDKYLVTPTWKLPDGTAIASSVTLTRKVWQYDDNT